MCQKSIAAVRRCDNITEKQGSHRAYFENDSTKMTIVDIKSTETLAKEYIEEKKNGVKRRL